MISNVRLTRPIYIVTLYSRPPRPLTRLHEIIDHCMLLTAHRAVWFHCRIVWCNAMSCNVMWRWGEVASCHIFPLTDISCCYIRKSATSQTYELVKEYANVNVENIYRKTNMTNRIVRCKCRSGNYTACLYTWSVRLCASYACVQDTKQIKRAISYVIWCDMY